VDGARGTDAHQPPALFVRPAALQDFASRRSVRAESGGSPRRVQAWGGAAVRRDPQPADESGRPASVARSHATSSWLPVVAEHGGRVWVEDDAASFGLSSGSKADASLRTTAAPTAPAVASDPNPMAHLQLVSTKTARAVFRLPLVRGS
jgi:hypothetical protein